MMRAFDHPRAAQAAMDLAAWGRAQLTPLSVRERRAEANNLTAARLAAASAVVFAHAWPIAHGAGTLDPVTRALANTFGAGVSLATLAVGAFFVVSGYLVAKSAFARQRDLWGFARARALRLYPALVVNVLLVAVIIGPLISASSLLSYFGDGQVWKFVINNALMWNAVYTLPGVFESQPLAAVNGSLWTLPIELRCYAVVGLFAALTLFRRPRLLTALIGAVIAAEIVFADANLLGEPSEALNAKLFLVGVLAFLHRDRIPASLGLAGGVLLMAWIAPWPVIAEHAAIAGYVALVLWVGLIAPRLPSAERWLGDPSYGIYIYAFPIQQICVMWFGADRPWLLVLLAGPLALLVGMASWRWIEAPALALKNAPMSLPPLGPAARSTVSRAIAPVRRLFRR